MNENLNNIIVTVKTAYLSKESEPTANKYVFAYFINIQNNGSQRVQLLTRHWIITDANRGIDEVKGEGVVGEQPHILPGESYNYNSYTILKTPVGSMKGSYGFINDTGEPLEAAIPIFSLAIPRILN